LYDQTENRNDLKKSPKVFWLENGGNEANATEGKITVSGQAVYGICVTGYSGNIAYRNNATKGIPVKDEVDDMIHANIVAAGFGK
jgi:hypothetical protein